MSKSTAKQLEDARRIIPRLEEENARLRRGLGMIEKHDSFAATVARRVLLNDGTYK